MIVRNRKKRDKFRRWIKRKSRRRLFKIIRIRSLDFFLDGFYGTCFLHSFFPILLVRRTLNIIFCMGMPTLPCLFLALGLLELFYFISSKNTKFIKIYPNFVYVFMYFLNFYRLFITNCSLGSFKV